MSKTPKFDSPFLAGYVIAYPKESRVVAIEMSVEPQTKAQTTSL